MTQSHSADRQRLQRLGLVTKYGTLALLICSVGLNVLLSRRLVAFMQPEDSSPLIGSVAPAIAARTLRGQAVDVRFDGRPMILYYFSPNCGWCERNWTNVKALVAAVGDRYRFVGLSSVPDVSAYVARHEIPFEVYSGLTLESARMYHFGGTPQTVVVAADGRIAHAWSGAYRNQLQREVERALGIVLPGLSEPPAALDK
jgi:peroxiredoxin